MLRSADWPFAAWQWVQANARAVALMERFAANRVYQSMTIPGVATLAVEPADERSASYFFASSFDVMPYPGSLSALSKSPAAAPATFANPSSAAL